MRKTLAVLLLLVLPLLPLEAGAPTRVATPKFSRPWYGQASWYGRELAGHKMANGRAYDPSRLTVAHPYLPLGMWVRVTNVRTGHGSFAKVTDRGPYQEGREMDVSEAIADRIDLKRYGVEKVKIEIVRRVGE